MKRFYLLLTLLLGVNLLLAQQDKVAKIDALIPALQYDSDFMVYSRMDMLDGFDLVRRVNGYMKFVAGQKVYALEKVYYSGKDIKRKITYFYQVLTPIAISIEKKGTTRIYYLDAGQVIGSKHFKQADYKPYGGTKPLDLRNIPLDKKTAKLKSKYLEPAGQLISDFKTANQKILNYGF